MKFIFKGDGYQNANLVDNTRTVPHTKFTFGELMRDPDFHDAHSGSQRKVRGSV